MALLLSLGAITTHRPGRAGTGTASPAGASASVHGVVRDPDGRPIAGARVTIARTVEEAGCLDLFLGSPANLAAALVPADALPPGLRSATTGPGGGFSIPLSESEAATDLLAIATAPGHAAALARAREHEAAGLRLAAGWQVSIQAMTIEDQLIDGAAVTLVPLDLCRGAVLGFPGDLVRRGSTGADGRLEIPDVPEGVFALHVAAPGREGRVVLPLAVRRDRRSFRVRLPAGASRKGAVVFPDGETAVLARVLAVWGDGSRLGWAEASTQSGQSEFRLTGLPVRTALTLFARSEGGLRARPLTLATVGPFTDDVVFTLRLEPSRTVRGRLGPGQRPGALAVTLLYPDDVPRFARSSQRWAEVEDDGTFVLEAVPPGITRLRLEARGFGRLEIPIGEGAAPALGALALPARSGPGGADRPGASVEIRVTRRGDGKAADLVRVEAESPEAGRRGDPAARATLYGRAPGGILRLHPVEGEEVRIAVGHPEGGPSTSVVIDRRPAGARLRPGVVLQDLLPLRGLTVSSVGNAPVEGAEVEAGPEEDARAMEPLAWLTRSRDAGAWSFAGLPPGRYALAAAAPGYVPALAPQVALAPDSAGASHTLVLSRPASLRGRVTGLRDGERARVTLHEDAEHLFKDRRSDPGADGEFGFVNLNPGTASVDLWVAGSDSWEPHATRSARVEIRAGETTTLDFDLTTRIRLTGAAFLGPDPLPGARLGFYLKSAGAGLSHFARTDAGGRYEIDLPMPGGYAASIMDGESGNRLVRSSVSVEVSRAATQAVDLRFSARRIVGRVTDGNQRPLAGAHVSFQELSEEDDRPRGRSLLYNGGPETGAEGSFEMVGLPPGRYSLRAGKEGFATRYLEPIDLPQEGTVSLGDVVLVGGVALGVRITGPEGEPLPGASVSVLQAPEGRWVATETTKEPEGTALLENLPEGPYILVAESAGLAPAVLWNVLAATRESPPVTLSLTEGGTLDLTIVGSGGLPLPREYPTLIDQGGFDLTTFHWTGSDGAKWPRFTDAAGHLVMPHVRPGTYLVGLGSSRNADLQTVVIREGETTRVVLVTR